jgi:hypothetical protein
MKMHKTAEMEKPRPTRKTSPQLEGRLSGEELGKLAKRMVDSNDPTETAELNEAMVRGFYGNKPHA